MPAYMKRFVFASLTYLALATVLGFFSAVPSMSYFTRYAHVHLNLLGFMSMMVFGIGYFILPRFNGAELAYPKWVTVHFWLANASLIGMVTTFGLDAADGGGPTYHALFMSFATLQAISIFMFVFNIWKTLSRKQPSLQAVPPAPIAQPAPKGRMAVPHTNEAKAVAVSANSRVADLIDAHPPVKQLLVAAGLSSLALPGHIDMVRQKGVTLGMACRNHGLELDTMIEEIETSIANAGIPVANKNVTISGGMLIGDVLRNYPETRAVFQHHFGSGCFDCPGQAFESVAMACQMHGINEQQFLRELSTAVD